MMPAALPTNCCKSHPSAHEAACVQIYTTKETAPKETFFGRRKKKPCFLRLLPSRLYCRFRNHAGSQRTCALCRGLYRRSGIAPCPEDRLIISQFMSNEKIEHITFQPKTSKQHSGALPHTPPKGFPIALWKPSAENNFMDSIIRSAAKHSCPALRKARCDDGVWG